MSKKRIDELSGELLLSERRRLDTQRLSGVGFWELNHHTDTLYWSEEIFAIYGLDAAGLQPSYELFARLIHDDDREMVEAAYRDSVNTGDEYNIRFRIKAVGSTKWIEARGVTYYDREGRPERSIGTAQDISEIVDAQQAIEHLASHDELTDLPNRKLFSELLRLALRLADRNNSKLALLFIDLDNFKRINDRSGHDVGDEVLVAVAQQLKASARASDAFARIGGDEFVGVLAVKDESDVDLAVQRVKNSVERTYETKQGRFPVTVSIGVTVFPFDADEPDALLRHADHAMYEAKELGRSRVCYFDAERHKFKVSRLQFLREIENAISNNEFVLYFQPKITLKNGSPAGAEALLRWFRPDGAIAPSDVVAAINGTSLEWELDTWVIEALLAERKRFRDIDLGGALSLNVNSSTIENSEFPDHLSRLLANADAIGDRLELEVLEVSSIKSIERTNRILRRCKAQGAEFSLDDFGTGYSSLTYFHALPVDKLKVDKRFVKDLLTDSGSLALIKSILALAQANNRPVIAEGIESYASARMLLDLGCDYGQGFGLARPMTSDAFVNWLENWDPQSFAEHMQRPDA